MAKASITGYRSPVDLGIGRTPLTTDPELYDELTDVYNAIHLLNQYLDRLRTGADAGGGSEQAPDISAGFTRFFVVKAAQTITKGDIISPRIGTEGYVKGVLANGLGSSAVALNTGVALSDAAVNEDVRIGVGPAVVAVSGATSGQIIYGINSRSSGGAYVGKGGIYTTNPGSVSGAYSIPIGVGVASGFAIIGNYVSR